MNYAVDRKSVCDALGLGLSKPSSALLTSDATDPSSLKAYPYNVARRSSSLRRRVRTSFSMPVYTTNPQQVTFSQLIPSTWPRWASTSKITPISTGQIAQDYYCRRSRWPRSGRADVTLWRYFTELCAGHGRRPEDHATYYRV